ncbi:hypothetical protein [Shewanella sp. CAL98-MNA-CIBAN-0140]|jgi:hypothetical protein|uniref:hypothetical protein n=1 Tax=unclassified Shewanella TaxID=196818 RepID=UPI00332A502B
MKKYSSDKNINNLVYHIIKSKGWEEYRRGRHLILIAPNGRKLSVPGTPSDVRAFNNFKSDVRRLQGD